MRAKLLGLNLRQRRRQRAAPELDFDYNSWRFMCSREDAQTFVMIRRGHFKNGKPRYRGYYHKDD